jgi:hypothetical protein
MPPKATDTPSSNSWRYLAAQPLIPGSTSSTDRSPYTPSATQWILDRNAREQRNREARERELNAAKTQTGQKDAASPTASSRLSSLPISTTSASIRFILIVPHVLLTVTNISHKTLSFAHPWSCKRIPNDEARGFPCLIHSIPHSFPQPSTSPPPSSPSRPYPQHPYHFKYNYNATTSIDYSKYDKHNDDQPACSKLWSKRHFESDLWIFSLTKPLGNTYIKG